MSVPSSISIFLKNGALREKILLHNFDLFLPKELQWVIKTHLWRSSLLFLHDKLKALPANDFAHQYL